MITIVLTVLCMHFSSVSGIRVVALLINDDDDDDESHNRLDYTGRLVLERLRSMGYPHVLLGLAAVVEPPMRIVLVAASTNDCD